MLQFDWLVTLASTRALELPLRIIIALEAVSFWFFAVAIPRFLWFFINTGGISLCHSFSFLDFDFLHLRLEFDFSTFGKWLMLAPVTEMWTAPADGFCEQGANVASPGGVGPSKGPAVEENADQRCLHVRLSDPLSYAEKEIYDALTYGASIHARC